jgi:hypothetical protein
MTQTKNCEGVSDNLIVAVNAGMDGSRRLVLQGWRAQSMVAPCRSKPLRALRSTKLNKVFTYGIVAMWGTRFAHLGTAADNGDGWRQWGGLAGFGRRHRQASVLLQWKWRHQRGRRSSAILLRWSIWQGRQHTGAAVSFTRRLGFRLLRIKICHRMSPIYRAFCSESYTANILTLSLLESDSISWRFRWNWKGYKIG